MDFTSANVDLWNAVISCGMISVLLLLGNFIRRKISLIGKAMIPTSVLAGFIGMFLRQSGLIKLDTDFMEMLTYHALAIGFIALSLRTTRVREMGSRKGQAVFDSVNSGMLIVSNYLIQGILGLTITIIASLSFAPGFFKAAGILLPMGFGQGPGQANNIGSMYEAYGFIGGQSFALAIASMGFLSASIGGLSYFYYMKKRNLLPKESKVEEGQGPLEVLEESDEVPLTEPVDRLTLQLSLIFLVYGATYVFSYGFLWIFRVIPALTGLYPTVAPLIWGFNFLIASSFALVLRSLLLKFRQKGWMNHQYPNTYLLNRISGLAFDVMIVAAISTINIIDLKDKWLVFLLVSILGAFLTLFYNIKMAKRIYPAYPMSGTLGIFGMMTGTASTGIMLLRQTDPLFRTPMSTNLVTGTSTAIVFAIPVLILVGLAPQSDSLAYISLAACLFYWALLHFTLIYRVKKRAASSKQAKD